MSKKIVKVGNSSAVIIDQHITNALGLKVGDRVDLSIQDGVLLVTPLAGRPASSQELEAIMGRIFQKYGKTFKDLS